MSRPTILRASSPLLPTWLLTLSMSLAMSLSLLHPSLLPAASASPAPQRSAGEIAAEIRRLGVVGSVLYVAAHPDDENSRLLAWLVGERGVRAGYLSLTRGDGGQNLIGKEQGDLLGLIRTYELLAARAIDGAEQQFTRARDFGYSKSADESLRIWGKDAVLADVVRAVRRFAPDVIITRFTTRPPNHGHHTASALLAAEAFAAAADPARFADPSEFPGDAGRPWQAARLLYNVSTWNRPSDEQLAAYLKVDVGGYDPVSGRSWGEVAAASRSQHKSQGFGVASQRGPILEYFEPLAGSAPKADPLDGLDFSWGRFPGTKELAAAIGAAASGFDLRAPHASVPALLRVRKLLAALPASNRYRAPKLAAVEALIADCLGLHAEVRAEQDVVVPGAAVKLQAELLNRSPVAVRLVGVRWPFAAAAALQAPLAHHAPWTQATTVQVPVDAAMSTPIWLRQPSDGGLHTLAAVDDIGRPDGPAALVARFTVEVGGERLELERPVVSVTIDPVRGELRRLVDIGPAVILTPDRDVVMVPAGATPALTVAVRAGTTLVAAQTLTGTVRLDLAPGWRAEPASLPFALRADALEQVLRFQIHAPPPASGGGKQGAPPVPAAIAGGVVAEVEGQRSSWRVDEVRHDHLPPLTVRRPAALQLVPLRLATGGKRIGYVPGPGDRVAECLAAVGYDVTLLPPDVLASTQLGRFDAILVGVRAFNAEPRLAQQRDRLLDYVAKGGRLVVQYQTNSRVGPLTVQIGPWPLEIGRARVTDETAAMTWLQPADPLRTRPNALDEADFAGWVQERGLYYAERWDPKYQAVLQAADPGEPALDGGLLLGKHGKGLFVYTGLAFFRQLPAGVPGAYRLLANVLAR